MPRMLVWTDATKTDVVRLAVDLLAGGGLVGLPTETVYGLAARADSEEACARIFTAKGRPPSHPLIVHVGSVAAARPLVVEAAHDALERWGGRFWPGPLTLVLPRTSRVPDAVTGGGLTVALRVPRHPVMAAVLEACPFGLAAPSANRYQSISPTTAAHVARGLGESLELIIDGGPCAVGLESTIVAPAVGPVDAVTRVRRLGGLALDELRACVPHLVVDAGTDGPDEVHAAPGRDRRHYAPTCAVVFVTGLEDLPRPAPGLGYLTYGEAPPPGFSLARALPTDPEGYGRGLFAALHDAESSHIQTLYVRRLPSGEAWAAARDRLTRAAAR